MRLRLVMRSMFVFAPRALLRRFAAGPPLQASSRDASAPAERRRIERVLAAARTVLATAALIAIYSDPTQPRAYASLCYALLIAYVLGSAIVWLWLRRRPVMPVSMPRVVHGTDIVWAGVVTTLTQSPSSPFFPFFTFVLLAAAYRWGLIETLLTTAVSVGVLLMQDLVLLAGGPMFEVLRETEPEVNRFIVRSAYLVITGVLLASLAQAEKRSRAETAAVARMIARARREGGYRAALVAVLEELLDLFRARAVLLAVRDGAADTVSLWTFDAQARDRSRFAPRSVPAGRHLFDAPPTFFGYRGRHGAMRMRAVMDADVDARPAPETDGSTYGEVPRTFLIEHDAETLLAASWSAGADWTGRVFLIDPAIWLGADTSGHVLQTIVRQVTPTLHSVYLAGQLRSRVGAIERARVARDLHDGSIQSLIALEMHIDVLRRRAGGGQNGDEGEEGAGRETAARMVPPRDGLAAELSTVQERLRTEVLGLRELMYQMRPLDFGPRELLGHLASIVDRFRRDTGIDAQFMSSHDEVELPPRIGRELARILQEALVNVRRHSGARRVFVRLESSADPWRLIVDDDGRGFEFAGRFSQAHLDRLRKGPFTIKERVRAIRGDLVIESTPGVGSRLEITFLPHSRERHG